IIIPGAFEVKLKNKFLQKILYKFYNKLDVTPEYHDHRRKLMFRNLKRLYKKISFINYNHKLNHLFRK
ncbi:MAG: hypothetical protein AABY22_16715, partial [Nanoarchaeota archaeon]